MRAHIAIAFLLCATGVAEAESTKSLGLNFLDKRQLESIPPAPPPLKGPPPATVDLTDYGYFPPPGDQGKQGSCVGWAVAYGLKSYQKNREYRLQSLDANFRFSPAFVYNQVKDQTCDGGSNIADALNVIESQGALPLEDFHYDDKSCAQQPTDAQIQSAWEYRIAKWMQVNVQSLTEMKAQIARGIPVVVGIHVADSFQNFTGGGVYRRSAKKEADLGGHALLVVGYSEALKAFKVMNSWGPGWGDGGFAWIDYATFQSIAEEGYVTIDIFLDHIGPAGVRVARHDAPAAPAPQPQSVPAPRPEAVPLPSPPPAAITTPDHKPTDRPLPAASDAPPAAESAGDAKIEKASAKPGEAAVRGARGQGADGASRELTPAILSAAVRSTTKPNVLFKWKDLDVYPYSVWLDLPDDMSAKIARVEYWFNHPSFVNPKRSEKSSNIFIANWRGYGCIEDAKVVVFLKSGQNLEAPFDLCAAQRRF